VSALKGAHICLLRRDFQIQKARGRKGGASVPRRFMNRDKVSEAISLVIESMVGGVIETGLTLWQRARLFVAALAGSCTVEQ
jgi:hypothetical protein